MTATIAITRGESRFDTVRRALDLIADQVDLRACRQVLIKPNLVSTVRQLASTHADAMRATLEFVRARYDGPLCIAEGSALAPTFEGYERFGYLPLAREYKAQLVDLNASETVPVRAFNRHLRPVTLRMARLAVESDFRISVSPPKTHDRVTVTLSIKNMVMGSLVNPAAARPDSRLAQMTIRLASSLGQGVGNRATQIAHLAKTMLAGRDRTDKMRMHQGFPVINLNIARLAPQVLPSLAVIDGFEGMEGDGPTNGEQVDWRVALAGRDAVAVDSLTAHLMGFDPQRVGYLVYCQQLGLGEGNLARMEVRGGLALDELRRPFAPPPTVKRQGDWELQDAGRWLRA